MNEEAQIKELAVMLAKARGCSIAAAERVLRASLYGGEKWTKNKSNHQSTGQHHGTSTETGS